MANQDAQLNTTPYNDEELNHFKKLLKEKQEETHQEKKNIKVSLDNLQSNSIDENSAAAHHQGDIASEEDERQKFLIMLKKQDDKLDEITAALDRIEMGTYGVCENTGQKIQKERLEAIPQARFCVQAKRAEEA